MNKLNFTLFLVLSILLLNVSFIIAQHDNHDEHMEEHHHAHGDHQHEFGGSLGITHLEHDNEFAPIIHLHYSKRLGEDDLYKHFALGLGLETIIFEEMHYTLMGVINIYPFGNWEISLSPGVLFIEAEEEYESAFAFHAEIGYGFDLDFIEIGPVVGASFSGEEKHFSIGLHIGKGF